MNIIFIDNNISLLFLLIIISSFKFIKNEEKENADLEIFHNIKFPSTLTLLSQCLIMVANDGIYYFNSDLKLDESKKISFINPIVSKEENEKTTMVQFSENNGGYIMIIVKEILYILNYNGSQINYLNLSDYSIDAKHYSLIPYKRVDNFLYYLLV